MAEVVFPTGHAEHCLFGIKLQGKPMIEILIGIFAIAVCGLISNVAGVISFEKIFGKLGNVAPTTDSDVNIYFISAGGTCRDPMAAAITNHIFEKSNYTGKIPNIHARAIGPAPKPKVSYAARMAIKSILGQDLLVDHYPQQLSEQDIMKADILLVMDKQLSLKKILPSKKTYILKEFFGQKGDIKDPWPDGKDEVTLKRYVETAKELQSVIESGFKILVNAIQYYL
jgi:protein-tyrosine-phosphatase